MINKSIYVPNILLCGDKADFLATVDKRRPFKIFGQINFEGEINGQSFNFREQGIFTIDGNFHEQTELPILLKNGSVDYIIFTKLDEINRLRSDLLRMDFTVAQIMTTAQFNTLPTTYFFDTGADLNLMAFLKNLPFKTLLDVDGHFAKSRLFTKGNNDFTEMDCICAEDLLPIKENIYSHVYKNFSECCFKHYDAVLIEANSPLDFDTAFLPLENCADVVITFARYNSDLMKHIRTTLGIFEKIGMLRTSAGAWLICYLHKPPEDFAMYVITHKHIPPEFVKTFPEGYRVIQSGKAISPDLGYIGDDTGENISHLNPFVNENDVLYWVWKNTSHTIIGFSHYHRFFTTDNRTLLTTEQATRMLDEYDIIVNPFYGLMQKENIYSTCGEITKIAEASIIKAMSINQPEYLEFFDAVMNSPIFYKCNMFITRKYVFDAYCNWLFSFYLDAVHEVLRITPLSETNQPQQRIMAYLAEIMLTVWLTKNRLRVKELNIILVDFV